MKALFPCEGSIIVNKQDLDPMNTFYNTQLMKSNMTEYLKTTNAILQVGNLSYVPENSNFVVNMSELNTIGRIKTALNIEVPKKAPEQAVQTSSVESASMPGTEEWLNTPITDEDISSNPFFTTMTEV